MTIRNAAGDAENGKKRRKRKQLHEVSIQNDIQYRGPINYQGFQVLGWFCIVLTALTAVLKIGAKLDESVARDTASLVSVLEYVTSLSLPFLLIANFSKILSNREGYRKQLLRNGAAALGIAAVSILFFSRYFLGAVQRMFTDPEDVMSAITSAFARSGTKGFIAFNLFVDLFLCTLTMYFMNARPKRVFTGKKVLILRFLTILPIAYEVCSLWLKIQASFGRIVLPFWSFPLLTVKPPMTFVLFLFLAIHFKRREHRFRRHGRSHEEYLEFLETNRNSLHVSIYLAVMMVITAVLDILLLIVMVSFQSGSLEAMQNAELIMQLATIGVSIGVGGSIPMVFAAPFMLLYSYNREPKRKIISLLAPPVAIVLMIVIVLEGVLLGLGAFMEGRKINFREIMDTIRMYNTLI